MLDVPQHYTETIALGDDRVVQIAVKRFTIEEHAAFMRAYEANNLASRRVDVLIDRHKLDADKDDALTTLARLELDDPPLAERIQGERVKLEASTRETWRDAFARYVRVPAGQIPGTTGEVDGSVILATWPGRRDVFKRIFIAILTCNTLSASAKNALASALDSASSSPVPSPTPRGDAQATTADGADASSSVSPEAVTDPLQVDASSGVLALSS